MNADGVLAGNVEVIAQLDGEYDWDDFAIMEGGAAYVAQPDNAVAYISSNGQHTIIAGGGNSTTLTGPTSVTLAKDGKSAYVTTRGGTVDGVLHSGQVVQVPLLMNQTLLSTKAGPG